MAKNKLLLDVARGLQYQHLNHAVGVDVTITSLLSIFETLSSFAVQHFSVTPDPPEDLAAFDRRLAGPIGKYGLIDFEYACVANIESPETSNVKLLRELGFVPDTDGEPDDLLTIEDDPESCIRRIHDEISQNQTWLKLFFRTTDINFSKLDMKTRFRQTIDPELIQFPLDFRCVDACLTNAPFVWFNRHFYM